MADALRLPDSLEGFGEVDIREEIMAPLLALWGYRKGSDADVIRELPLRYPRAFLDRKKSTDRPLRGKADYVLDVKGSVRWIIETKPSAAAITQDDVEQAWTYANHAGVRAVYFCIFNGHELRVYRTNTGPDVPPMLVLSFTELRADPARLANVLGPAALKRDHPTPPIDLDPPLAPGLRSVARIVSGFAELHRCVPPAPFLDQLAFQIAEGALERSESGTLLAYMISRSPFRTINALNARLGLDRLELLSESNVLSTDEDHPTIFRQTIRVTLPHDAPELNLFASATVIDRNIECIATTTALAVLKGMVLAGDFTLGLQYRDLPRAGDNPSFFLTGKFHASLG